jgi:molybdopterin synthase sulfur carrier subunit
MAVVTVRVSPRISPGFGKVEVAIDRIDQLCQALEAGWPEVHERLYPFHGRDGEGKKRRSFTVLVNGENVRFLKGWETELKDGDEVYIMPVIAGG